MMKNEVAPGLQERYGLEDRARCPYGEANVSGRMFASQEWWNIFPVAPC